MHPRNLRIEEYTYELPEERVARYPLEDRAASKLLVYQNGAITEDTYTHIAQQIPEGKLMVFNQAKVVHARLLFRKVTGSGIEVFCLEPHDKYADVQTAMQQKGQVLWECMVGGAAKWKDGMTLEQRHENPDFVLKATIAERKQGACVLQLSWSDETLTFAEVLHHAGKVPLPPYMNRAAVTKDETTYQTVYAKDEGSVAAPTAGLHFTDAVLDNLKAKGITTDFVTLHVGAGTFIPVKSDTMDGHNMHAEWIAVTAETLQLLTDNVEQGIVAVGTTSCRTLESLYWMGNKLLNNEALHLNEIAVQQWDPYSDAPQHSTTEALKALRQYMLQHQMSKLTTRTQIIIAPGYRWKVVEGLVTNFHQPQSTLLLLVAALIGEDWRRVYEYALANDYRFLSYGDGSLLWGNKK